MGVLGDFVTGEIITHSPPVKISPGVKLSTDNYSAGGGRYFTGEIAAGKPFVMTPDPSHLPPLHASIPFDFPHPSPPHLFPSPSLPLPLLSALAVLTASRVKVVLCVKVHI